MKRILVSLMTLAICSAVGASPTVESEIRAQGEEFAAAWNKHDVKALAGIWAPDGDLINPQGRIAKDRNEIETLFKDEHTTVFAKSTYKNEHLTVHVVTPDVAVGDWDVEITGALGPDGKAGPAIKAHVTGVFKKAGGKWWLISGRAFSYLPMPPMPKKK